MTHLEATGHAHVTEGRILNNSCLKYGLELCVFRRLRTPVLLNMLLMCGIYLLLRLESLTRHVSAEDKQGLLSCWCSWAASC